MESKFRLLVSANENPNLRPTCRWAPVWALGRSKLEAQIGAHTHLQMQTAMDLVWSKLEFKLEPVRI